MGDFVVSESGVIVWKTPEAHPLLKDTDTCYPDFRRKAEERFSKGKAKGLPRICSENSEDACTWHYFSPLIHDVPRTWILARLFREAFGGAISSQKLEAVQCAKLQFWPELCPPPCRPHKEGPSEPDVLIKLGQRAVVLVEAKYKSGVRESTKYDSKRDQVIRLIDVGSWYARQKNLDRSYVIVLQYGDAETNAEEVVSRYAGNPDAIQQSLGYRSDLNSGDYCQLSRSVAFVRWPDPMNRHFPHATPSGPSCSRS